MFRPFSLSRSIFLGLLSLCVALCAAPASAKRLDGVFTVVKEANLVVLDYGEGS